MRSSIDIVVRVELKNNCEQLFQTLSGVEDGAPLDSKISGANVLPKVGTCLGSSIRTKGVGVHRQDQSGKGTLGIR